ncbi:MAG: hypothetical protein GC202_02090 [Alphaproteobacteria bacterium]|nr:hypothetical protein [Alphaproteobacteria bacterium]
MRDLMNNVHPVRAISPVSVSDDTALVSQIIDRKGYESLTFLIAMGSLADAGATFTALVEHDDDAALGSAAAVPDDMLVGTEVLASFNQGDDNETRKIGYIGDKRYVRLTITPAGNASAAVIAAIALLGHPAATPTPNPPV